MLWRSTYGWPHWARRSIWRELQNFQEEMGHQFGGTRGPIRISYPALNGWASDESIIITAEVPGVEPENLNISIVDQTLTLSGTRKEEDLPEGVEYHRHERVRGTFNRTIELPYKVDSAAVDARYEKGVLQITLPRAAEDMPRRIEVKTA